MEETAVGDFVGIDIGTTSIKCCILDKNSRILTEKTAVHNAWLNDGSTLRREQDPVKILDVLHNLIKSMEVKLSMDVAVSITGQMHGIVLWNGEDLAKGKFTCSPLITWMDQRVPNEYLDSLPRWDYGNLHIGFGMVILAWLHSSGQLNEAWTCCGTIMDMTICYLSQSVHAFIVMENENLNAFLMSVMLVLLICRKDELVPIHLLPTICSTEKIVGSVRQASFGLPVGAKLLASCGDLQSTVYPLLEPGTAVLNLGTSAQLCFVPTIDRTASVPLLTEPFFGKSRKEKIIVAASMNGGIAIDLIAQKVVEWASKIVSGTNNLKVDYEKLNDVLSRVGDCSSSVVVKPVFIPERADSALSYISGINSSTTIDELLHCTARGIISNIFRLLPPYQLREWGIERIRPAGNANKNYFIHEIVRQCQGILEVITTADACSNCSAAYGAALHALHFLRTK
uniref:Carbohydrate kinase FGGY N-terminal domain-containing protein n=1 Tax=Setaria digitata TaxID=48799 RepID=A0A915PKR2_9BILA